MLRTIQIPAGQPVLVTEYATPGPGAAPFTLVGVGTVVVYLGEDSSVTDANGSPLAPGTSTQWTGSAQIWAYSRVATTLLLTVAHTPPALTNQPRASDSWNLPFTSFSSSAIPVTLPLVRDAGGADTSGGIYVAAQLGYKTSGSAVAAQLLAVYPSGITVPLLAITLPQPTSGPIATSPPYNTNINSVTNPTGSAALPPGGGYTLQLAVQRYTGTAALVDLQGLAGAVLIIPT